MKSIKVDSFDELDNRVNEAMKDIQEELVDIKIHHGGNRTLVHIIWRETDYIT